MAHCCDIIAVMLKKSIPADFVEQYRMRTAAALHAELKLVPGIESVLDELDERAVPFCVASSGSHEKMQTTLGITGLLPRFQGKLFSVTEVARAKPYPDVFLYAAAKSGALASECVVVEDTPTGVAAGVAAGMIVYGYCAQTPQHRLQEAGAHYTFDSMSKLPQLLSAEP
jgi:HAD superfamily hydrolase (TIGR01509 family)